MIIMNHYIYTADDDFSSTLGGQGRLSDQQNNRFQD